MQIIIILGAILAFAAAAPTGLDYNSYVPLSKTTFTSSSQAIDHGSTHVLHPVIPLTESTLIHSTQTVDHGITHVLHPVIPLAKTTLTQSSQSVDHGNTHIFQAPLLMHDVDYQVPLAKTTITNSNHVVDHGSSTVLHAPLVPTHVAHSPVFVHSGPIVSYKTPDSAISHHSSTIHETVPVVNSIYAFHQ